MHNIICLYEDVYVIYMCMYLYIDMYTHFTVKIKSSVLFCSVLFCSVLFCSVLTTALPRLSVNLITQR